MGTKGIFFCKKEGSFWGDDSIFGGLPTERSFIRVLATASVVPVDLLLDIKENIFSCFWLIASTITQAVATEPNPLESLNFLCSKLHSSSFSFMSKRFSWSDHYSYVGTPTDCVFQSKV